MKLTVPEMLTLIYRRIKLFFYGDRTGVSIWWLANKMSIHPNLSNIVFGSYFSGDDSLHKSFLKTQSIINKRTESISPEKWNAGNNLATFLFDYVVKIMPQIIVETGVANGITTQVIQAAIDSSEVEFHSIDTNPNCAKVNSSSKNWTFHHLKGKNLKVAFRNILKSVPQVDLWIHDSDHSYIWQKFEYNLALKRLNPGGVLISDDVDFSQAWGELVSSKEIGFICTVVDNGKCFGIAQKAKKD